MKKLLTVYLLLLSGSAFAECKVEVTAVTSDCDVFGSSCFDYYFVNDTDTDYMACVWDSEESGGFAFCTYADRHYTESFKKVRVGPIAMDRVKRFDSACLSEADSEKLFNPD